jgi:DNA polymerase-3 subunit gamma/tau
MRDLAAHLRHLFVVQTLGEVPESFAVTSEHTDRLQAQAARMNQAEILRAIDLLASSIAAVKDGSEPRIQLEMALLKASQPSSDLSLQALMFRIEQLEQRVKGGAAADAPADAPPASESEAPRAPARAPQASPVTQTRAVATPAAAPALQASADPDPAHDLGLDLDRVVHLWPAALEVIGQDNELLGAALAEAKPHEFDHGRLVIAFPPGSEFIRKKAEAKRDVVQRAIHGLTGARVAIAFETSEKVAPPPEKRLSTDELVESVKRDFAATELDPTDIEGIPE